MTPEDTAGRLIAAIGDSMLPYATADMIIEEIKKGSPDTRDKVMRMLMDFLADGFKRKKDVDIVLKEVSEKFGKSDPGAE